MLGTENTMVGSVARFLASCALVCLTVLVILGTVHESEAKTELRIQDTGFVRFATGINIYGNPRDWHILAPNYGYYVSDEPMTGSVVSFAPGSYGTDPSYGLLGIAVYYQDSGSYWKLGVRYAYSKEGESYLDPSYAKEQEFRVEKKDPKVRYIYRTGMSARSRAYYYSPEYAGYDIADKYYPFSSGIKEMTIFAGEKYTKAYVGAKQVIRVLARAEVGETIWVFIQSPYSASTTYAQTVYYPGKESLKKYDPYSSEAYRMYYAKDYGDSVLDLGYADYSKIAGGNGELTITIKKGDDPKQLETLQTISLYMVSK